MADSALFCLNYAVPPPTYQKALSDVLSAFSCLVELRGLEPRTVCLPDLKKEKQIQIVK